MPLAQAIAGIRPRDGQYPQDSGARSRGKIWLETTPEINDIGWIGESHGHHYPRG